MPVHAEWYDDEQTIVRIYFDRMWTWEDVYGAPGQTHELADSVPHTFHILVDLSNIPSIPSGISIRKLNETAKQRHDRTGMTVICGVHPALKPIINTILKASFTGNFRFVADLSEGVAAVEKYKEKIQQP